MAKHIHVHIHRPTTDAGWNESDHPRKDDGKFGSGGGSSSGGGSKEASGKPAESSASAESLGAYHLKRWKDLQSKGLHKVAAQHLAKAREHGASPEGSSGGGKASAPAAPAPAPAAAGNSDVARRIARLEGSIKAMKAKKVLPKHQTAHQRDIRELEVQLARLAAHSGHEDKK